MKEEEEEEGEKMNIKQRHGEESSFYKKKDCYSLDLRFNLLAASSVS